MNHAAHNLLQIARELADVDPILSVELERSVTAAVRSAVINPGVQKFEDHIEKMVAVLKAMTADLEKSLDEIDSDDASEFAKFFEDVLDAEEEQLKNILNQTKFMKTAFAVAARTAGPLDFVKNLFKKKPSADDDAESNPQSYTMDDSTIDEFVEGKRDWADPSHYIEQEFKENKDFFNGVDGLLTQFDRVKKSPSRTLVESLKKAAERLARLGENILKGVRKHLMEPVPKVEITEDGMDSKPKAEPKKDKNSLKDLEKTVEHYTDMLRDSLGDEKRTLKFLKELFHAVGPLVEDDRATIASKKILPALIRTAHATPRARPVLIPVIRRIVNSSHP